MKTRARAVSSSRTIETMMNNVIRTMPMRMKRTMNI